ncbi:hypothetical protein NKH18_09150 [Streptomyces sp. M10(2022)]
MVTHACSSTAAPSPGSTAPGTTSPARWSAAPAKATTAKAPTAKAPTAGPHRRAVRRRPHRLGRRFQTGPRHHPLTTNTSPTAPKASDKAWGKAWDKASDKADRVLDIVISRGKISPAPGRLEVKKGERIALRVRSDRTDTLHVHGYDEEAGLPAGRTATLNLTADRTGLFEVETHESGLLLTQLAVR